MGKARAAFMIGAIGALLLPACTNAGVGGSGGGGSGVGGSGTCVPTCAMAVAAGGVPCGGSGSADAYMALNLCGCGTNSACNAECGANFCLGASVSTACNTCLQMSCGAQLTDCAND